MQNSDATYQLLLLVGTEVPCPAEKRVRFPTTLLRYPSTGKVEIKRFLEAMEGSSALCEIRETVRQAACRDTCSAEKIPQPRFGIALNQAFPPQYFLALGVALTEFFGISNARLFELFEFLTVRTAAVSSDS